MEFWYFHYSILVGEDRYLSTFNSIDFFDLELFDNVNIFKGIEVLSGDYSINNVINCLNDSSFFSHWYYFLWNLWNSNSLLFISRCTYNTVNWDFYYLMLSFNMVKNFLNLNDFGCFNWDLTNQFNRNDSCFGLSAWHSFLNDSINWHWSNWLRSYWDLDWFFSNLRYRGEFLIDNDFSFSMNFRFTYSYWLSDNFLYFDNIG